MSDRNDGGDDERNHHRRVGLAEFVLGVLRRRLAEEAVIDHRGEVGRVEQRADQQHDDDAD